MFISVQDLELRKLQFDTSFAPGQIDLLDELRQSGDLKVRGTAELVDSLGEIRVRGDLEGALTAECDRCLEPVTLPVQQAFNLVYQPDLEVESPGDEIEIAAADTEVGFYEGAGLELADIVREQILLSLPLQRLCSEGCLGLCPECGQNRNLNVCQCQTKATDERWAALKKISMGD